MNAARCLSINILRLPKQDRQVAVEGNPQRGQKGGSIGEKRGLQCSQKKISALLVGGSMVEQETHLGG